MFLLAQIRRWLMQPLIWRLVSFALAVFGLLCYALSSSFNYLYGDRNFWKIFLFVLLSFIFCVAILFANVWQRSTSLRLKAHIAFFVLTITSVYSFFFDKAVNGKPDAYSLISCASFAVMSLSLSRHTPCGFEVDMLYFFLGALIVQLMKIKLLFGLVGACFSYSLIILRSFFNDLPPESGYLELQDQHHVVVQVDSSHNSHHQVITDIALIMPRLKACVEAFEMNNSKMIDMVSRHVREYIRDYSNNKDLILVDNNLAIDALQPEIVDDLHNVVKLMMAAGFEKECCDVYISCRKQCLEDCLSALGLPQHNTVDTLNMETTYLDFRTQNWIKTSNVAMRILFPNEKRLCGRVFSGFTSVMNLAFMEICRERTICQLQFANSFADGISSPNILPRIPRVCEALHDLIPEFELQFSEPLVDSLRKEAINVWKRLGNPIKSIFTELEDLICHDRATADCPGGLYPISTCVMNYLYAASQASGTLEKGLEEHSMVADREGTSSSLVSIKMAMVMELLGTHLELKSKSNSDPAIRYVFMMNNGRYIEQKAKEYQLGTILGDDWITKHTAKVQQYIQDYQRSSWDSVLGLLKLGQNDSGATELMIENIRLFNMEFKEICRVQSTWFVLDELLREEIRISLEKILLPAYGNFIGMLQNVLGSRAYEYIEYSMYDIDALLNDLFCGSKSNQRISRQKRR